MVGDQAFSLNGFRLQAAVAEHSELVYGAAFREVISERLGRFLPNLRGKRVDSGRGPFVYLAFVQSPFLGARVNNERTHFQFPAKPDAMPRLPVKAKLPICLPTTSRSKTFERPALAAIAEDLKPYLDEINTGEGIRRHALRRGRRPWNTVRCWSACPSSIDQIPVGASKTEMDMALHRQLHQRQVKLKQEGQRILAEASAIQEEGAEAFYRRF